MTHPKKLWVVWRPNSYINHVVSESEHFAQVDKAMGGGTILECRVVQPKKKRRKK